MPSPDSTPHSYSTAHFSRRSLLARGAVATASIGALPIVSSSTAPALAQLVSSAEPAAGPTEMPLSFNSDGRFKVVQFNDTQDDHLTDRRTIEFMELVLDHEKPDFALINGDVITGGPTTPEQVYQALNNVVLPMETRSIPWAITFGNHDEDSAEENNTGVLEADMADFVRSYRYNLNPVAGNRPYGHSDRLLLIRASKNPQRAAFALWLLDSGNYMPGQFQDQVQDALPYYDYIRPAQVQWYLDSSRAAEERFGARIPGLMFFHIPTYEHRDMWFGGPTKSSLIDHHKARSLHKIEGVKNEDVYYGSFNSGIYAAVRDRGDVLGIYCGHDHINTYHGDYFGVELGYSPGTGFGPYGLDDGTYRQHSLRGARVFELNEETERVYESTRLIFARDLGLDMAPAKQPLNRPAPMPDYVTLPTETDATPDKSSFGSVAPE